MTTNSEEIMKQRDEAINQLTEELLRLNLNFDEIVRTAGFTEQDLDDMDTSTLPTELRTLFEQAVEKAKREGSIRAAQAEATLNTGGNTSTNPGAGRKGVIRM